MKGNQTKFEDWITNLYSQIEEVGECEEWQGKMDGPLPVVYCPAGFRFEGSTKGMHSVRTVVWAKECGEQLGRGLVIRMTCRSLRCVRRDHMRPMTRAQSCVETGRRGDFKSLDRTSAAIARRRARADIKLSMEKARSIRASDAPSDVEAATHGVSRQTIDAIRRGERWVEAANGASVFNWRPAA